MKEREYTELYLYSMKVLAGRGSDYRNDTDIKWVAASRGDTYNEVSVNVKLSEQDKEDIIQEAVYRWIDKQEAKFIEKYGECIPNCNIWEGGYCYTLYNRIKKSWYRQTLLFTELNFYRKNSRNTPVTFSELQYDKYGQVIEEYMTPLSHTVDEILAQESKISLYQYLERKDKKNRKYASIASYTLKGYTQKEISKELNVAQSTVSDRLKETGALLAPRGKKKVFALRPLACENLRLQTDDNIIRVSTNYDTQVNWYRENMGVMLAQ